MEKTANVDSAVKTVANVNSVVPARKSFYKLDTTKVEHATRDALSQLGQTTKGGGNGRSVLSFNVCCAEGNRHSLKLSKSLYEALYGVIDEELEEAKQLQVFKHEKSLIISEELPDVTESFKFSNPTSMMIYDVPLVRWIVDKFKLDFTKGRTSRSFQKIEVIKPEKESDGKPYAIIDMTRSVK